MAHSARRPSRPFKAPPDFLSTITVDRQTLSVHTEDGGRKLGAVVSRIRHRNRVIHRLEADYRMIVHEPDFLSRLDDLMERTHEAALCVCWSGKFTADRPKSAFLDEAYHHLRQRRTEGAVRVLRDAVECYKGDPFVLSHYGYVLARTGAAVDTGIHLCSEAIRRLEEQFPSGARYFSPAFYLNLGRARLAAGDKPQALEAFAAGLEADPAYGELLWELGRLGRRKRPVVPFLSRRNPVNKYLGLLPGLGLTKRRRRKGKPLTSPGRSRPEPPPGIRNA